VGRGIVCAWAMLLCGAANADEYYEFFSIRCIPELHTFLIDTFGIYNIPGSVWGETSELVQGTTIEASAARSWAKHEMTLKALRDRYGIYVLGDESGAKYKDQEKCELGGLTITMTSKVLERTDFAGAKLRVKYSGYPKIRVLDRAGREIFNDEIYQGNSLQISVDEDRRFANIYQCKWSPNDALKVKASKACTKVDVTL